MGGKTSAAGRRLILHHPPLLSQADPSSFPLVDIGGGGGYGQSPRERRTGVRGPQKTWPPPGGGPCIPASAEVSTRKSMFAGIQGINALAALCDAGTPGANAAAPGAYLEAAKFATPPACCSKPGTTARSSDTAASVILCRRGGMAPGMFHDSICSAESTTIKGRPVLLRLGLLYTGWASLCTRMNSSTESTVDGTVN